jgi:Arc/MetJ-type ribon-helix-helix transcriptional regulator
MARQPKLTGTITEKEFDNGYWYGNRSESIRDDARISFGQQAAQDELEKALKHFIRTGEARSFVKRGLSKSGTRDVDKGLRLDRPVVHYTSNKETKDFIVREPAKLEPGFKRLSGTRYLLNRWREAQISSGRRITYGDLVKEAIRLNKTKHGPLRAEYSRYINFMSDFMAANRNSSHAEAVKAWHEIKAMDAPKTYAAWCKTRRR